MVQVANIKRLLSLSILFLLFSCQPSQSSQTPDLILPGDDPNFKILAHQDQGFKSTNRKVVVFDIPIYAYAEVEDQKLLHAANIMAQYLDNDENGEVDNPFLLKTLHNQQAALFMWKTENQINLDAQDLGADETRPSWHENEQTGRFDASLEEVWHVITHSGYANAYPEIFGEQKGTAIATAMDIARGGQFKRIPKAYPATAWYSYYDRTCRYDCQIAEYFYWGMTSKLGAQAKRLPEIEEEWRLASKMLFESKDTALNSLLSDPKYRFPKVLPNGQYRQ